jgi:hypothetical protein
VKEIPRLGEVVEMVQELQQEAGERPSGEKPPATMRRKRA